MIQNRQLQAGKLEKARTLDEPLPTLRDAVNDQASEGSCFS
jgi:hypothetical protein